MEERMNTCGVQGDNDDGEFTIDDLKQENRILRDELTKLCQALTIQAEQQEVTDKLRDDLANQKLLNNELLRRLQHVEQEKTELEDKIACSNLRFIEIATLRLKLNEEERLHHSCRQKVSQLENDRSYLQKEVQQLTKVNQNLHQFVYSPAYSKQMQGLKNESKKKERKLLEIQTQYRSTLLSLQSKTALVSQLEQKGGLLREENESLQSALASATTKLTSQSKEIKRLHEFVALLQMKQEMVHDGLVLSHPNSHKQQYRLNAEKVSTPLTALSTPPVDAEHGHSSHSRPSHDEDECNHNDHNHDNNDHEHELSYADIYHPPSSAKQLALPLSLLSHHITTHSTASTSDSLTTTDSHATAAAGEDMLCVDLSVLLFGPSVHHKAR